MRKQSKRGGDLLSNQEFWILTSIAENPKHGYAIANQVSELTDGKLKLSAATLYENLGRMVDSGLIERDGEKDVQPGKRRKVYRLTGLGIKVLSEQWKILDRGRISAKPTFGYIAE